jgi:hypothetical protein
MAADNGGSYMDAMLEFGRQNHLEEFEELIPLLHANIRDKIATEAIRKKFFRDQRIENSLESFF